MQDEDLPRPPAGDGPRKLDTLGVEELRRYIAQLQAEIARAEQAIAQRLAHRGNAETLFKALGPRED